MSLAFWVSCVLIRFNTFQYILIRDHRLGTYVVIHEELRRPAGCSSISSAGQIIRPLPIKRQGSLP